MKKRFFLSVVEEGIMNRHFFGFSGGRIEIYDENSDSPYALTEIRFFLPDWMAHHFREMLDFKKLSVKEMKYLRLELNGEDILKMARRK